MSVSKALEGLGYKQDMLFSEQQPKDIRNTGFLADSTSQLKAGLQQLPSVVTGLLDIPANLTGLGNDGFGQLTDIVGEATGFQPSQWAEQTKQREYSLPLKQAQQEADQLWSNPNTTAGDLAEFYLFNPAVSSGNVMESLPSMLAGGVAAKGLQVAKGMSGAVAAGVGEGAVMAGQAMNDIQTDDPQAKAFAALGIGGIGAVLGTGGGKLADKLGVFDANQLFLRRAGQGAVTKGGVLSNAASMAAKSMVIEAAEEVGQTYFETGISNVTEGKPFDEGMNRSLVEAGLAGGLMGVVGGGVSGALTRSAEQVSPEVNQAVTQDETVQTTGQDNASPQAPVESPLSLPNMPQDEVISFADGSQARASEVYQTLLNEGQAPEAAQKMVENFVEQSKQTQQQREQAVSDENNLKLNEYAQENYAGLEQQAINKPRQEVFEKDEAVINALRDEEQSKQNAIELDQKLRDKQARELADQATEVVRKKNPTYNQVKPEMSAIDAIRILGGINADFAISEGIDPEATKHQDGFKKLFNRGENSLTFEETAEALDALGYEVRDESGALSHNKVLDIVSEGLRGNQQYTPQGSEIQAQSQQDERLDDYQEEQRFNSIVNLNDSIATSIEGSTLNQQQKSTNEQVINQQRTDDNIASENGQDNAVISNNSALPNQQTPEVTQQPVSDGVGSAEAALTELTNKDNGIIYSKKESSERRVGNAHPTTESLSTALNSAMGKAWTSRLLATNKFKIITTSEAKAIGADSNAQAFYNPKDDTTYFVADNISQETDLKKLALHELGVHALQLGKSSPEFKNILKQLDNLINRRNPSPELKAAIAAAERAGTSQELMNEEILGYLVEKHPNLNIVQKVIQFFRKQLKRLGLINGLTEADIVSMANSALTTAPESLAFDGDVKGSIRDSEIQNTKLLAFNGKPSNLNGKQYAQVRSKEFKKWFGDWENNPEKASKVLDENGEPLVVYHGSPLSFNEFGKNSWFTTAPDDAGTYATMAIPNRDVNAQIYPVFLNIRKPKSIDSYILKTEAEAMLDKVKRDSGIVIEQNGRKHFVVKNPSQIKSSSGNAGEFSKTNNDIRYSYATDAKDFFTGKDSSVQTLADVAEILDTGKPKREKIDKQYWLDKITTNLTDLTRPFDRFIDDTFDPLQASQLISGKDKAGGIKQAYEQQAMDKFGRPLSTAIRAITKEVKGMKYQTAKDMAGHWMSARYAPDANSWLMEKDQKAIDELDQQKFDAINDYHVRIAELNQEKQDIYAVFYAITNPTQAERDEKNQKISSVNGRLNTATYSDRDKLDKKVAEIEKNLDKAKEKQNKRRDAINRQEFIDLPKIKQDLIELRKDRAGNATEITELEAILDENVGLAGGLNNYTAAKLMEQIEEKIPSKLLEKAATPVYDLLAWKLDNDIKDGKVSQETANAFPNFKHYVPLTGDPRTDDSVEDFFAVGSVNQAKDHVIEGRTGSIAQNAIDASFEQVEKSARYHGWNDFKNSIHSIYISMRDDLVANGLTQAQAEQDLADQYHLKRRPVDTNIPAGENDIIYRKDNKGFIYTFNNQAAMEALREMNNEQVPTILKHIQAFTSLQSRLVTIMMTGFAPTNFLRDVMEKSENIRTKKIAGHDVDMNEVGKNTLINGAKLLTRIKMVASVLAEGQPLGNFFRIEDPNDPDVIMLKEYLHSGASSTYGQLLSRDSRQLAEKLEKLGTRKDKGWDALLLYNASFETISGFSAYKSLIEAGVPPKLAASESLNLMNFRKQGKLLSPIRALYMFVNPTAQGAHQLAKALSTKRGRYRMAAYTLASAFLYSVLRSVDGDDEELGFNRMDEQSNYALYRNIHIPFGGGEFIKVPVGFGMQQLAWAHGVNLVRTNLGKMTAKEFVGESALLWQKATMPVSPAETSMIDNPATWMAQTFSPQIVKPLVNVALDRTAFGSPLTNQRYEKQDTAKALQGRKQTPQEYKDLAVAMTDIGFDMYPEQLRELVRGYFIGHMGDILRVAIENPNAESLGRNVSSPAFSRFISGNRDEQIKRRMFYKLRDRMNEAAVKRSTERNMSTEERELAAFGDKIKKLEGKARGKFAAATRAEKKGNDSRAANLRAQAEKLKARYMEMTLDAFS